MSIQQTDQESAAVAKNPAGRVSLASIEAGIRWRFDTNLAEMIGATEGHRSNHKGDSSIDSTKLMSICTLVMMNGFVVLGKSAPMDPANFNRELGMKFAYEDAIRQLWPLMAFARLSNPTVGTVAYPRPAQ